MFDEIPRRTVIRTVRLTEAESKALDAAARKSGDSVSDLIRRALARLLRVA